MPADTLINVNNTLLPAMSRLCPSVTRLFVWLVLPYLTYLTLYGCTNPSNDVAVYTCAKLNEVVYPAWETYAAPQLAVLDEKTGFSTKTAPLVSAAKLKWSFYDSKYSISHKTEVFVAKAYAWASEQYREVSTKAVLTAQYWFARTKLYYTGSMSPIVEYYFSQYKTTVENSVDSIGSKIKLNLWLALESANYHSKRAYVLHVRPAFASAVARVKSSDLAHKIGKLLYIEWLYAEGSKLFDILVEKSAFINAALQEKSDFVRAEFNNLVKFDNFKKKFTRDSKILDVVNEILEDVTSAVEEKFSDDSSEDDEPITLTTTLTATVTSDSELATGTPDADVAKTKLGSAELNLGSQGQIDNELEYWKTKVEKTLELAGENLVAENKPFLDETIARVKEVISSDFQALQRDNYGRYKAMAELISAIDKDSEHIRTTNKIIEEPDVDRQIMRDKIAEAYNVTESTMKRVELILNQAHVDIMTHYFEVTQGTVDVLESFAETTMLDFSSRLTNLVAFLATEPDFDDTMSWRAWKSFHKVKDLIFSFRDKLFNDANEYKTKPRGSVKPKGLEEWATYLDSVNFHIKFLLQDNDEYLKLVRAKANVAYQLREGLTRTLIKAAEEEAAEENVKAEEHGADGTAEESPAPIPVPVLEPIVEEDEEDLSNDSAVEEPATVEQDEDELKVDDVAEAVPESTPEASEAQSEDAEPADAQPAPAVVEDFEKDTPVDESVAVEQEVFEVAEAFDADTPLDNDVVAEQEVEEAAPEEIEATD